MLNKITMTLRILMQLGTEYFQFSQQKNIRRIKFGTQLIRHGTGTVPFNRLIVTRTVVLSLKRTKISIFS